MGLRPLAGPLVLLIVPVLAPAEVPLDKLPGIALDETSAKFTGEWEASQHTRPFVGQGYHHDRREKQGEKSARFEFAVPNDGDYHVLLGYTPGSNRASSAQVTIETADGEQTVGVNQKDAGPIAGLWRDLGRFPLLSDVKGVATVSNAGADGHVVVDSLLILKDEELAELQKQADRLVAQAVPAKKKPAAKPRQKEKTSEPAEPVLQFAPLPPTRPVDRLTPEHVDALLAEQIDGLGEDSRCSDEVFLRRACLDLIGRQPTLKEMQAFHSDSSAEKRSALVERLLARPEYGSNWADFWSDTIGSRQQEPELTFHDYKPFKRWLTEEFNRDTGWDEIVFRMLTATGKVGDRPEATFIGFHQGNSHKIAGEASRIFLGIQIDCAECHDHPFVEMPQTTFHGMAAYFARVEAKIPQRDSDGIEVKSRSKGEHKVPGAREEMVPTTLDGCRGELGQEDLERRRIFAEWVVAGDNPYFAQAYTNRVWHRLMGRGFYEPVDDMGELSFPIQKEIHDALSDHFIATGFDHRELFRLIMNSRAYQRALPEEPRQERPFASALVKQLRGDEVFRSLEAAVALPNLTPEPMERTGAIRFPPPPKSTRDLVNAAFGYDPSLTDELVVRTMRQAMFLMNNEQIQAQVNAAPQSGTVLAKLLREESDDATAVETLYQVVLARRPRQREREIALKHIEQVGKRKAAFEDLLWALLNSTEFTTRY